MGHLQALISRLDPTGDLLDQAGSSAVLSDDSEVQFMGLGGPVAPHSRDCCQEILFDKRIPSPANLRACDNCYCKFLLPKYVPIYICRSDLPLLV